ncbi:MAG: isopentenyl-diphosphate delta-isomerase idi1 [Watsoniomyces obsoletus]|nr:MAG: isopentenyl-diphosphate delta-isomerase idi1 [Watsoniomyces obsoletus]
MFHDCVRVIEARAKTPSGRGGSATSGQGNEVIKTPSPGVPYPVKTSPHPSPSLRGTRRATPRRASGKSRGSTKAKATGNLQARGPGSVQRHHPSGTLIHNPQYVPHPGQAAPSHYMAAQTPTPMGNQLYHHQGPMATAPGQPQIGHPWPYQQPPGYLHSSQNAPTVFSQQQQHLQQQYASTGHPQNLHSSTINPGYNPSLNPSLNLHQQHFDNGFAMAAPGPYQQEQILQSVEQHEGSGGEVDAGAHEGGGHQQFSDDPSYTFELAPGEENPEASESQFMAGESGQHSYGGLWTPDMLTLPQSDQQPEQQYLGANQSRPMDLTLIDPVLLAMDQRNARSTARVPFDPQLQGMSPFNGPPTAPVHANPRDLGMPAEYAAALLPRPVNLDCPSHTPRQPPSHSGPSGGNMFDNRPPPADDELAQAVAAVEAAQKAGRQPANLPAAGDHAGTSGRKMGKVAPRRARPARATASPISRRAPHASTTGSPLSRRPQPRRPQPPQMMGSLQPSHLQPPPMMGTLQPSYAQPTQTMGTLQPGQAQAMQAMGTVQPGQAQAMQAMGTVQPGHAQAMQAMGTVQPGHAQATQTMGPVQPSHAPAMQAMGSLPTSQAQPTGQTEATHQTHGNISATLSQPTGQTATTHQAHGNVSAAPSQPTVQMEATLQTPANMVATPSQPTGQTEATHQTPANMVATPSQPTGQMEATLQTPANMVATPSQPTGQTEATHQTPANMLATPVQSPVQTATSNTQLESPQEGYALGENGYIHHPNGTIPAPAPPSTTQNPEPTTTGNENTGVPTAQNPGTTTGNQITIDLTVAEYMENWIFQPVTDEPEYYSNDSE